MLPALVTLSLFLTSAVCIPVLAPRQGTPITVYVQKDPNDPNDLQPVTTLAPIAKRDSIVMVSDNTYPDGWRPISTIKDNAGPGPTPVPQTPQATTPDTSSTGGNDGSNDGGNDLLSTVNYWRRQYGKSSLSWDQSCVDAASNTGNLNGGGANGMTHHPPSFPAQITGAVGVGEVIAPGTDSALGKDLKGHTPFDLAMIGWLCEVDGPNEPVHAACADMTAIYKAQPVPMTM